jgi:hypothetical protein
MFIVCYVKSDGFRNHTISTNIFSVIIILINTFIVWIFSLKLKGFKDLSSIQYYPVRYCDLVDKAEKFV